MRLRDRIAQEDPLLWGCDFERTFREHCWKVLGGGIPRDYRGEWREEMRQPQRLKAQDSGSSKLRIGQGHLKQEFATASTALFNKFVSWGKKLKD